MKYKIETGYEMPELEIECGAAIPKKRARTTAKPLRHGYSKHPLYGVWSSMRDRCSNPNNKSYHRYGGRGITVSDEWYRVEPFIEWALKAGWKPGLQLDRTNNDGNYQPNNCRFVTRKENANNMSFRMSEDCKTEYEGVAYFKFFSNRPYRASVGCNDYRVELGYFKTAERAVTIRNKYIKENNLPVTIQRVKRRPK